MLKSLFATAALSGSLCIDPGTPGSAEREGRSGVTMRRPTLSAAAPGISAVYDAKKKTVYVKWQQTTSGIKTFVVQRSSDNFKWTTIEQLQAPVFNGNKQWQYADVNPGDGENYYRLQCTAPNSRVEYSASVMVITGTNRNWVMYPVPVRDELTLQYKGTEKIAGVINIQIQNIQGSYIRQLRCASNNTIIKIPVNNLGSGIYDIRIVVKDEIVWNQRFTK